MMTMPAMPHAGEWTVDDLRDLPEDGLQYELADGILLVTPAPRPRHQRVVGNLYVLLRERVPAEWEVFVAPLDFQPSQNRSLQPDLLVVRRSDVGEENITQPLLLAVEVLSPSTRAKDLILKKALYEDSGVPSYWVIDPDEPSLVVWQLREGAYLETARVQGDELAQLMAPFAVEIRPSSLLT
jgi:Uma2 family endonuclease